MQPIERPAAEHDSEDPECCCAFGEPGPERNIIQSFSTDGKPLYMFKDDITAHCPWDINCSCKLCADDRMNAWIDRLDNFASKPRRRKGKKSTQSEFYKRLMKADPNTGPFGEDNGKFVYLVDYLANLPSPVQKDSSDSCKSLSLDKKPLDPENTIDISRAPAKISAAEATLNWQTENALAQNHVLKNIDSKISTVEAKVDDNTKW
ncbi:hypothetical protein PVK06_020999 [Gossypium arboreum]|uniref:Uncharacterized protein n=1 Tax=Gossypium arboreum TaxID=29729 RepID=A0ABR0PPB6_GOSAR|nr:hypothetical protein PVK06_020999 [Gossypium arboreum]